MTSLAVIFILLFVVQLNYYGQKGEISRGLVLAHLQKKLQEFTEPGADRPPVRVEMDPKDALAVLIIVPQGLLNFAVNKADISAPGLHFLEKFVPKLARAVCTEESIRNDISLIVVEGHADSTGPEARNWPLSQDRSGRVLQEGLRLLDGTDRECFRNFLSASGRGSADPVLNESGEEDKDRSRRVVFKVRVRSLEQQRIVGIASDAARTR